MKINQRARYFFWLASVFAVSLATPVACKAQSTAPTAQAITLSGEYQGTHDPSIAKDGDTYYVFATGAAIPKPHTPAPGDAAVVEISSALSPQFPLRCSKDLVAWKRCGAVFPSIPVWIRKASPLTKELWAPDISYFDRGAECSSSEWHTRQSPPQLHRFCAT